MSEIVKNLKYEGPWYYKVGDDIRSQKKVCIFVTDEIKERAGKIASEATDKNFSNSDICNDQKALHSATYNGYLGQLCVAKLLGQEVPEHLGNPDGGVDFTVDGVTYDLCTRSGNNNIFAVPVRKQIPKADYLIFATIVKPTKKEEKMLNPADGAVLIEGIVSAEVISKLKVGSEWTDEEVTKIDKNFIDFNGGKYYGEFSKARYLEFANRNLYFPLQLYKNGKKIFNPDLKFLNSGSDLGKYLLKNGKVREI